MKSFVFILYFPGCLVSLKTFSQPNSIPESQQYQMENMAEKRELIPEEDSYELDLEQLARHPLNLNTATEEDLRLLQMLNIFQVRNFISYRKLLGPLLSVYELQAVPGWSPETIRQLLPYVIVRRNESLYSSFKDRLQRGTNALLIRAGQTLEKSRGYQKPADPDASYYQGSAQKIFMRYTFNYTQLLSFGFSGDKDAGESFLRGSQRYGFDFYSFHFFMQLPGLVRTMAIGDFTVSLGQGLIQWQSVSFTKSSSVLNIKRESACFRPYRSSGEYNFHRGMALSLQKNRWQANLFISYRQISSNRDTVESEDRFTSFENSGYHRTAAEIADRNNTGMFTTGANLKYKTGNWMAGFNVIHFRFSRPYRKKEEPFNLYSFKGDRLSDYSFDYQYTIRNVHLFGELAVDDHLHPALLQGALISLGKQLDLSFLYRNFSAGFQSLFGDAFSENAVPNNETGFYAGMSVRPVNGIQMNIFYDLFEFPWLKYRVDAPSGGRDLLVQMIYQPEKTWRISVLYKNERKLTNTTTSNVSMHQLIMPVKQRWRLATNFTVYRDLSLASRIEMVSIQNGQIMTGQGFLGQASASFKKFGFTGNVSAVFFETSNYDSRIYMFEPDLSYSYALPVYSGKGIHYYISLRRNFAGFGFKGRKPVRVSGWLKWGQTFYPGTSGIGNGLDEIPGNRKSELSAQILFQW